MKKAFILISALMIILFSSMTVNAISGEGTAENPFLIETEEDFMIMNDFPAMHYKLNNDITVNSVLGVFSGTFDGDGFAVTTSENYVFSSNNGAMKNVTINGGMLVKTNVGSITNVSGNSGILVYENGVDGAIDDCCVSITENVSDDKDYMSISHSNGDLIVSMVVNNYGSITNCRNSYVGITTDDDILFAGIAINNYGNIQKCGCTFEECIIEINTDGYYQPCAKVGGIVLYNCSDATITQCYTKGDLQVAVYTSEQCSTVEIGGISYENSGQISECFYDGNCSITTSSFDSALTMRQYFYGIAKNGTISDCYSNGTVTSSIYAGIVLSTSNFTGDFCGITDRGTVNDCYSCMSYLGEAKYKYIKKYPIGSGSMTNSYYLSESPSTDDSTYGTPASSGAMKMQTLYNNWDFDNVWAIDSEINDGYPYLRWEYEEDIVDATSVAVDKNTLSLNVGETEVIVATVLPENATNKNVIWESSDTSVVTVDSGTVTAVGAGNATIIVTTEDGNYKASCSVIVTQTSEPTVPDKDKTSTLRIGSVTGKAGEKATVSLSVENNPGILGMLLKIAYNEDLELVSVARGTALENLDFIASGDLSMNPVNVAWEGLDADSTDGKILDMEFVIPEDAEDGDVYDISLSYTKGEIYDNDLNDIDFNIVDGSIIVKNYTLGDINEDDIINIKDITLLRRGVVGGYGVTLNKAADVNCDGVFNIKDITILRRYVIGGYGVELG